MCIVKLTPKEFENDKDAYHSANLILDQRDECTQNDVVAAEKAGMIEWDVDCDVPRGMLANPTWKFLSFQEYAYTCDLEDENE